MQDKFIPELHDIGKLVNDNLKNKLKSQNISWKGHTFVDLDFSHSGISKPSSPSWWGQYHHSIDINRDINSWAGVDGNYKLDLFLLILADHLASSCSRTTIDRLGKGAPQNEVVKLWDKNYKDKKQEISWSAFNTVDDLQKLFDEIQNCPYGKYFLTKYRNHLLLTPEDKSIPRNLTSLYTHLELVGKIYRVLKKNVSIVQENNGLISFEYNCEKVKTIKEAEGGKRTTSLTDDVEKGKWQARFVKAWIKFAHSFVRLQDINLLKKREELINCLFETHKDEVIFTTPGFVALFLPLNQNLDAIFKPFFEWGFYIEVIETIADLGIFSSMLDKKVLKAREKNEIERLKVLNNRNTRVYKKIISPEYLEKINPPLCDICQKNPGVERVYENIREWLCDRCIALREMGEPFREYGEEWGPEGINVCWFKFTLDQEKLNDWLIKSFENYVEENFQKNDSRLKDLKEEFRPLALQVDFNNEYKEMLNTFWQKIKSEESLRKDFRRPVLQYYELGVFKFSSENIKMIVKMYNELFITYFPDCESNEDSPINLSLSIANIKYPIRDHWRFFEQKEKSFLNIKYHRVFDCDFTKKEIDEILKIDSEIPSTYLHNLVQLERTSPFEPFVTVEIFNNRKKYPSVNEAICKGVKASKLLNFYKLMGD